MVTGTIITVSAEGVVGTIIDKLRMSCDILRF